MKAVPQAEITSDLHSSIVISHAPFSRLRHFRPFHGFIHFAFPASFADDNVIQSAWILLRFWVASLAEPKKITLI
jgi:hypothetical protein